MAKPDLKSLSRDELREIFSALGEPSYRADQLLRCLYEQCAAGWDDVTVFSKALRQRLREQFHWTALELVRQQGARDATLKFLWRLEDGALVESVLIPANAALYGEASDRHTLCVSTQVGCAYGCRFCASGLEGWKRNLTAAEIVDQTLAVERWNLARIKSQAADETSPTPDPSATRRLADNLVIMGMGEPLANYANLMKALAILNAPWGGGLGARKITISTSGLAPQIVKLADEPRQFRLAISLHGATDAVRRRIMPINRKYPLAELIRACQAYQLKKGRMITLEYILIAGINDGMDQIAPLARLAKRLRAKINLIPYNRVEGLTWRRPSESDQERFRSALAERGVTVTLRHEKGEEIDAACGQLRLKAERERRLSAEAALSPIG